MSTCLNSDSFAHPVSYGEISDRETYFRLLCSAQPAPKEQHWHRQIPQRHHLRFRRFSGTFSAQPAVGDHSGHSAQPRHQQPPEGPTQRATITSSPNGWADVRSSPCNQSRLWYHHSGVRTVSVALAELTVNNSCPELTVQTSMHNLHGIS